MENSIFLIVIQKNLYFYTCFSAQYGTLAIYLRRGTKRPPLVRGALITGLVHKRQYGYELSEVDCIALPAAWATSSIDFVHRTLELLAFFVPQHQENFDIFNHCSLLYQEYDGDREFFRNLFLCKFFILTGLYPEPKTIQDSQFIARVEQATSIGDFGENDGFLQKKMIDWLKDCENKKLY